MREDLLKEVINNRTTTVFTDFFDTIVHRKVNPNYVVRLWSKYVIREAGLPLTIDQLYFSRNDATLFLTEELKKIPGEIPYETLIRELYKRLENNDLLGNIEAFDTFYKLCNDAEYVAETSVQYLNESTVETLKLIKEKGLKVYCVSDFYTTQEVLKRIIKFHNLSHLFDGVYVSAQIQKTKLLGGLYDFLLNELKLSPEEVVMVGDSRPADVEAPLKKGIRTLHIPNKKRKREQFWMRFGNDKSALNKVYRDIYKNCNSRTAPPFSDYIIFFGIFIERLYAECRRQHISNLFFLAREGLFMKKMFERYQDFHCIDEASKIDTHYLKMSRQSAMQISLKPLEIEKFEYFRQKFPSITPKGFLMNFGFEETSIEQILVDSGLEIVKDKVIDGFFEASKELEILKNNVDFIDYYETNRVNQKNAFAEYLKTFDFDFQGKGITLVDVGWGGSMQGFIYEYFEKKVPVTGYYLGVRELKPDINKNNRRIGLNFALVPYRDYSYAVQMTNTEIYEQISQAPHGSTIGYSVEIDGYTNEYFEANEKKVYEKYIGETQKYMLEQFDGLNSKLSTICYDLTNTNDILINYKLKIDSIVPKRKIKRLVEISKGFYSNIGTMDVGESNYKADLSGGIRKRIPELKSYIFSPEKMLTPIIKTKMTLYMKSPFLFIPSSPIYYYIRLNRQIKSLLKNKFLLKSSMFR